MIQGPTQRTEHIGIEITGKPLREFAPYVPIL
jgi:hypothetical protein